MSIFIDFYCLFCWVFLWSGRTGVLCSSVFTFPSFCSNIGLCFHFFCLLCLLFCFLTCCFCFIYVKSSLGREPTGSSYLLALTTWLDPNAKPGTYSLFLLFCCLCFCFSLSFVWCSFNNSLCFHFRMSFYDCCNLFYLCIDLLVCVSVFISVCLSVLYLIFVIGLIFAFGFPLWVPQYSFSSVRLSLFDNYNKFLRWVCLYVCSRFSV